MEKSECYINPEFTSTSEKVQNAKKDLGFMAKSDFKESIKKTMEWVIREALGE